MLRDIDSLIRDTAPDQLVKNIRRLYYTVIVKIILPLNYAVIRITTLFRAAIRVICVCFKTEHRLGFFRDCLKHICYGFTIQISPAVLGLIFFQVYAFAPACCICSTLQIFYLGSYGLHIIHTLGQQRLIFLGHRSIALHPIQDISLQTLQR